MTTSPRNPISPEGRAQGPLARRALRISLSGGGVRATLFAFGAILYTLDSGDHHRVRIISSVSGGSIANAILATTGAYSRRSGAGSVRDSIARATWVLSEHGTFFTRGFRRWAGSVSLSALLGAITTFAYPAVILVISGFSDSVSAFYAASIWPVSFFAAATAIYLTVFLFLARWAPRQATQRDLYARAVSYTNPSAGRWQKKAHKAAQRAMRKMLLSDIPDAEVEHVFWSTDLLSGQAIRMSKDGVYMKRIGASEREQQCGKTNMTLTQAIYASAAFPAVFAPLRTSATFGRETSSDPQKPTKLYLTDGGVFNNLGTEQICLSEETLDHLVVNASKPADTYDSRPHKLRWFFIALIRSMMIVQQNTVSPRLVGLRQEKSVAIADIGESPAKLAKLYTEHPDEEVRLRARALLDTLRQADKADAWENLALKTASVPTQLKAVGSESAAALLQHGYVSAGIAAHSVFGSPFDHDQPIERFTRLTARPASEYPRKQSRSASAG